MKKSLLALAVLGAFAGAASAQSTVTLSGTLDVGLRYSKNGSVKAKEVSTDGLNNNQIVFEGREDLGSGLWAGFQLNSGFAPDTGTTAGGSTFWNRRSTVSLGGQFGEVRLGRDYVPTFINIDAFSAFTTNGVGDVEHVFVPAAGDEAGSGNTTEVRSNNTVQYFLPKNIGGVYGNLSISAGEGLAFSRHEGGRVGYANGPLDVAFAYDQTHLATKDDKLKVLTVGGSYDFGVAKLLAQYIRLKTDVILGGPAGDGTQDVWNVGTVIPLGAGEIHAAIARNKGKDGLTDVGAKMASIGYVYNLSKRTALYGTYSYLKNDENGAFFVGSGIVDAGQTTGFKSQGAEFGLRHFF